MDNYLRRCSKQLFNDLYLYKYNEESRHAELEDILKKERAGKVLTVDHLELIFSDRYWHFRKSWSKPQEHDLEQYVKSINKVLNDAGQGFEEQILDISVTFFKNIEVVSIILAFVFPENYGILAPPPEHLLGFRRQSDRIKTLYNYSNQLRRIARHYDMWTFDVEKALWVIYQLHYNVREFSEETSNELWKAYRSDPLLLQIRAGNLLQEIWGQDISDAYKSEILKNIDPDVAMILAVREIETLLWKSIRYKYSSKKLEEIQIRIKKRTSHFASLLDETDLPGLVKKDAHICWKRRNLAIHDHASLSSIPICTENVDMALKVIEDIKICQIKNFK